MNIMPGLGDWQLLWVLGERIDAKQFVIEVLKTVMRERVAVIRVGRSSPWQFTKILGSMMRRLGFCLANFIAYFTSSIRLSMACRLGLSRVSLVFAVSQFCRLNYLRFPSYV